MLEGADNKKEEQSKKQISCSQSTESLNSGTDKNAICEKQFTEKMKRPKKEAFENLQFFLTKKTVALECLIEQCLQNLVDLKEDIAQPCTNEIKQVKQWSTFICLLIDCINDNLVFWKEEIKKETDRWKDLYGILLIDQSENKVDDSTKQSNGNKNDSSESADSMILPRLSIISLNEELKENSSSSKKKSVSPRKGFSLGLKRDHSDDALSEDDLLSAKKKKNRIGEQKLCEVQKEKDINSDKHVCESNEKLIEESNEENDKQREIQGEEKTSGSVPNMRESDVIPAVKEDDNNTSSKDKCDNEEHVKDKHYNSENEQSNKLLAEDGRHCAEITEKENEIKQCKEEKNNNINEEDLVIELDNEGANESIAGNEDDNSSIFSDKTEIYNCDEFFTAQDEEGSSEDRKESDGSKTDIYAHMDNLKLCEKNGHFIGGTIEDSGELEKSDNCISDTDSYIFNLNDVPAFKEKKSVDTDDDDDARDLQRSDDDIIESSDSENIGPYMLGDKIHASGLSKDYTTHICSTNKDKEMEVVEEGIFEGDETVDFVISSSIESEYSSKEIDNNLNINVNDNKSEEINENNEIDIENRQKNDNESNKVASYITIEEDSSETIVIEHSKDANLIEEEGKEMNTQNENVNTSFTEDKIDIEEEKLQSIDDFVIKQEVKSEIVDTKDTEDIETISDIIEIKDSLDEDLETEEILNENEIENESNINEINEKEMNKDVSKVGENENGISAKEKQRIEDTEDQGIEKGVDASEVVEKEGNNDIIETTDINEINNIENKTITNEVNENEDNIDGGEKESRDTEQIVEEASDTLTEKANTSAVSKIFLSPTNCDESNQSQETESSYEDDEEIQNALNQLEIDEILFSSDVENETSEDEESSSEEIESPTIKKKESVPGQVVTLPLAQIEVSLSQEPEFESDINEENAGVSSNEIEVGSPNDQVTTEYLEIQDTNVRQEAKRFEFKECVVHLERLTDEKILQIKKKMKRKPLDEDAEIDRLTNLKNLKRKRSTSSDDQKIKKKKPRKKKYMRRSKKTSEKSSSDDYTDTDSENDESNLSENIDLQQEENEIHESSLDNVNTEDLLAEILQYQITSDTSDDVFNEEDEDEEDREDSKKNKTGTPKKLTEEKKSKEEENKKRKKVAKWRNDPLLRGNLKSSSDSSDSEKEKKNRKRKSKSNNAVEDSDLTDADKDSRSSKTISDDDIKQEVKEEMSDYENDMELKPLTPLKALNTSKSIWISSSSDDSDIEFVSETREKRKNRKHKRLNSDSKSENDDGDGTKKKSGRKNIRAIISDETLEESTKKAIIEEKQRKERISQKQKQLESILSQSTEKPEEEGLILDIDEETKQPLVVVDIRLTKRLKQHQVEGVKFMWTACYESVEQIKKKDPGSGCILAHCMGLGKSFQVITLIHTLFKNEITETKHVLIICPLSTVLNWDNEFRIAQRVAASSKKFSVYLIGDQNRTKNRKFTQIKEWHKRGGVLIMGYEGYATTIKDERCSQSFQEKIKEALVDPGPDLVVLDEGHLLKNGKNVRTTTLMKIKTKRRIILTGTPLQNNLKEYYHMVNFVKPNLLGSYLEYTNRFVNPIMNGQYDDSTEDDVLRMKYRSHVLHKKLRGTVQRFEVSELEPYLPPKLDYVLFVQLHPLQIKLYKAYLEKLSIADEIKKGQLFAHYRYLQNIWTHPHLLYLEKKLKKMVNNKKIKEFDIINLDPEDQETEEKPINDNWWTSMCPEDMDRNMDYGPKFKIMLSIIEEAISVGDKILIFSNSLTELDCIEYFLKLYGTPSCKQWQQMKDYFRMDGTLKPECRMSLCKSFNCAKNKRIKLFLVSHKVGGLGLNLIAANRVILMDVNWNPSYDSQSIFRTYRFGQKKKCYVYRLVSMGTMEEVVYERCVTKLAIAGRVIDERQITRHYRSDELHKMYRANFCVDQQRPTLNVPEDVVLGKIYQKHVKELFKYHLHQSLLENLPHESLTEDEMQRAWDEFGKENELREQQLVMQKRAFLMAQNRRVPSYQKRIEEINSLTEQLLLPAAHNYNIQAQINSNNINLPSTSSSNVQMQINSNNINLPSTSNSNIQAQINSSNINLSRTTNTSLSTTSSASVPNINKMILVNSLPSQTSNPKYLLINKIIVPPNSAPSNVNLGKTPNVSNNGSFRIPNPVTSNSIQSINVLSNAISSQLLMAKNQVASNSPRQTNGSQNVIGIVTGLKTSSMSNQQHLSNSSAQSAVENRIQNPANKLMNIGKSPIQQSPVVIRENPASRVGTSQISNKRDEAHQLKVNGRPVTVGIRKQTKSLAKSANQIPKPALRMEPYPKVITIPNDELNWEAAARTKSTVMQVPYVQAQPQRESTSVPIMEPTEVIDVEQQELLSMLAQNHSISVSQIIKPSQAESKNSNNRTDNIQTASNGCDSRGDVILIE